MYTCTYIHIYWLRGCRDRVNSCNSYKRKSMCIQRACSLGLFQFALDLRKELRAGEHRATYRRLWVSLWFYGHERLKGAVCTQLTIHLINLNLLFYVNLTSLHARCGGKSHVTLWKRKRRRSYYRQIQLDMTFIFNRFHLANKV